MASKATQGWVTRRQAVGLIGGTGAVAAGRIAGAAMVTRLHGDAAFRADLDAARREIDAAKRNLKNRK